MGAVLAPIIFPALAVGSTAFNVAAGAINLAAYLGMTAASYLLQPSTPQADQEIGTKLSAVLGGAVNQSIHAGIKETAGSFIYKKEWGINGRVPNAYESRLYALSDREVAGFEPYIWGASRKCNYDPNTTDTVDGVNLGHPITAFTQDLSSQCVTTVKIADSAVTASKLAHNIVEGYENLLSGQTTANDIVDVTVNHGDADQCFVIARFTNTEGSLRNAVDVSLRWDGTQISSFTCSLQDDECCTIAGFVGGLGGSSSNVLLRVSGGFKKSLRQIIALPIW